MKAGKYTALEILKALNKATFKVATHAEMDEEGNETPVFADVKPEDVFGKYRVRIAGLRGIATPDHVINLQAGTEKVEVMVGTETYELTLEK